MAAAGIVGFKVHSGLRCVEGMPMQVDVDAQRHGTMEADKPGRPCSVVHLSRVVWPSREKMDGIVAKGDGVVDSVDSVRQNCAGPPGGAANRRADQPRPERQSTDGVLRCLPAAITVAACRGLLFHGALPKGVRMRGGLWDGARA